MSKRSAALVLLAMLVMAGGCAGRPAPVEDESGFVPIFDGRTLQDWDGDPAYWRVSDGSIVGETTQSSRLRGNFFLIWRGSVADFELKLEYRVSEWGNGGISYRNEKAADSPYSLTGYHADLDDKKMYVGGNYEEGGRTTLAAQGQKVLVPALGSGESISAYVRGNAWSLSTLDGQLGHPDSLDAQVRTRDWNEYHIVARGNRLQHYVNGVLMSDVTDNDVRNRRSSGLLGLELNGRPPMKVEYRRVRLKPL